MKFLNYNFYFLPLILCLFLNGCNDFAPATSKKIQTKEVTDISSNTAILHGSIGVEIVGYNDVDFGFIISTDLNDVNSHSHEFISCRMMEGNDFQIELENLKPGTQYYYCAWLVLNNIQYEYGAVKTFKTSSPTGEMFENTYEANSTFVAQPFSVSETEKVLFSPGNLQYLVGKNIWRFAEKQYTTLGAGIEDFYPSYQGWIDLFGWGTGTNPTAYVNDSLLYVNFSDWGAQKVEDTKGKVWRTLSAKEWKYILEERPNAKNLCATACVKYDTKTSFHGLIILPDNWDFSNGTTFTSGILGWTNNMYMAEYWKIMELLGAVFLPALGNRDEYRFKDSQQVGEYWTSTEYNTKKAKMISFRDAALWAEITGDRYIGRSVRLVKDSK